MITDQREALRLVEAVIDAEDWRSDKRRSWTAMAYAMVYAMDWKQGLICRTRARLAEAGGCSLRTVSSLLAWLQENGVLTVVETGATASFLGADTNRAPTYAFTSYTPAVQEHTDTAFSPLNAVDTRPGHEPVEQTCNPPMSYMGNYPLATAHDQQPWPLWRIPETPSERSAATETLLARMGLRHTVPLWRTRALLYRWWTDGWCIAGLLHALDHTPDGTHRGDAIRGATDPLRVVGHRLKPWRGHTNHLPAHLTGHRGDYQTAQAQRLERRITAAKQRATTAETAAAPAEPSPAADAARTHIRHHLATRRRRHVRHPR